MGKGRLEMGDSQILYTGMQVKWDNASFLL